MRACALCKLTARAFCESDQASLCWSCDAKVHGANFLVARHSRTLLCHACQSPTPWKASGPRLGGLTVSFCDSCLRRGDSEEGAGDNDDRDDDRSDGGGDGMDEDEEEEEDGDNDDDGEEGDNQVVPLSSSFSAATPPPPASRSSSEEDDSAGSGRFFCGSEGEVDESVMCSPPTLKQTAEDSPDPRFPDLMKTQSPRHTHLPYYAVEAPKGRRTTESSLSHPSSIQPQPFHLSRNTLVKRFLGGMQS